MRPERSARDVRAQDAPALRPEGKGATAETGADGKILLGLFS
jgi:hypothetical protein